MNIAEWLRSIGLERYEPVFLANEIDLNDALELSAEEIAELGLPIGARKKFVKGISVLREKGSVLDWGPVASGLVTRSEGERRQISVMFVDLVGSSSLSEKLDPEDMRDVLSKYHTCVSNVIRAHGGYVAKLMGDGVLIYFGYPRAHEDDTEQAVRAGLAIIEEIKALVTPYTLQVRVAVATGTVVVGDLVRAGESQERTVVGDTPNLAARLQTLANPNELLIAGNTREMIGELFLCRDLAPTELKGFAQPVRAWRVISEAVNQNRFEALRRTQAPLIGREAELDLVLSCWSQAKDGCGQVVLLSGEAGIGKSRLTAALLQRAAEESVTRLRYFCSPRHADSAFYPILAQLERSAGFETAENASQKAAKLKHALERFSGPKDLSVIADLLGLSTERPLLEVDPQKRKIAALDAFMRQLDALSKTGPLLIVFEDIHWIDPSSLEWLSRLFEQISSLPILLVMTCRPEFRPPWSEVNLTTCQLARFHPPQTAVLVEHIAGKHFPSDLIELIITRTDGVPLFIEEVTKSILESRIVREEHDRFVLTRPLAPLAVPTSLQASLISRLDRLGPGREVAQIGAVVGREFSIDLLTTIAGLRNDVMQQALSELTETDLIVSDSDGLFRFKHALVQDAAYATLLRARRQELHLRIARALEQGYPDTVNRQPEVLAHHFAQAMVPEIAIDYYLKSATLSLTRSAVSESAAQLRKALELIPSVNESRVRLEKEFEVQILLSQTFNASRGFGCAELGDTINAAYNLAKELGDADRLYAVLANQMSYRLVRSEFQQGINAGTELLSLARARQDTDGEMASHFGLGMGFVCLGRPLEARDHFEKAIIISDHPGQKINWSAGLATHLAVRGYLGLVLYELGEVDDAIRCARTGVAMAREFGHPLSTSMLLAMGCISLAWLGDVDTVAEWTDELAGLSEKHELQFYIACGFMLRGWLRARQGDADGVNLIKEGFERFQAVGHSFQLAVRTCFLVDAYKRLNMPQEGLAAAEATLKAISSTGERDAESELLRYRGEFQQALGQGAAAEASFGKALELAHLQGAKFLELRAAISVARLWASEGRKKEALDLLNPLFTQFKNCVFQVPELQTAKMILEECR